MADSISAFFSSLLPSNKGQTTPGRFNTESGTTGSAGSAPSPTSMPMRSGDRTAEQGGSRANNAAAPNSASPEELRNLRAQFLDEKFGPQGKKKRAGRTFANPKIESQS